MNLLQEKYRKEVIPGLQKEFQYSSPMQVPRLDKIVINMCVGEATKNPKLIEAAVEELTKISGQKPLIARAKKAISNFKLREGIAIGCYVTLRREKMWSFLERLQSLALPRVRDFRGMSPKGFDGRGNYNMGLREQIVFPEITLDKVDETRGMNITICTTAKNDGEGKALLAALGFPFRQ